MSGPLQAGRILQYRHQYRGGAVEWIPLLVTSAEQSVDPEEGWWVSGWAFMAPGRCEAFGPFLGVKRAFEGDEIGCWRWPPRGDGGSTELSNPDREYRSPTSFDGS